MKYVILTLIFLQTIYAQNSLKVSYTIKYSTEVYNEKTGTLWLDLKNNKSVFLISTSILKKELPKENNQINILQKEIERYVSIDFAKDSLIFKEQINDEIFIINESVPKMIWKLMPNSTKKIGNFNCYQATTNFRGRNYIAWYSPEYPYQIGPWKFNGLPGLIMEIHDDINRYYWGVTKIEYTNEKVNLLSEKKLYQNIDLKKYVELRYDKIMDNISARLPRGTQTQTIKAKRNSIEIKFEWEN